ncbi:MAG: DMT family transporter [Pseudomonadota bacterium]
MNEGYRGIALMLAAMTVFASQDGISRLLAEDVPPLFIVMIRYWAFAAFVVALSAARPGGVRAQAQTARPVAQVMRGLMLVAQIVLITYSFVALGLAETHALMAVYPLLIAAMGALFLGERVDAMQWAAIGAGFVGVLILLQPTGDVFDIRALIPVFCAFVFAGYGVMTRWVGQVDRPSVSFFYTGVAGAVGITLIGPFFWSEMTGPQWAWMALLCVTGAGGHFLLIKAYEVSEAARLQPFAYWQLVLASIIGVLAFGEVLDLPLLAGTAIVVAAGLFTLWRAQTRTT